MAGEQRAGQWCAINFVNKLESYWIRFAFFFKILLWLQYGEVIATGRENMRTQVRCYYFLFQVRDNGSLDKTNGRSDENKLMYLRNV